LATTVFFALCSPVESLMKIPDIKQRTEKAYDLLKNCSVCPRKCGVNRLNGQRGICGVGKNPQVSSYNVHFGEEPPISGTRGSGTIFFSNCNLRCIYCQNFPISQLGNGSEVTARDLARMMISLQSRGCHNVNLVTPSHVVPQILEALSFAWEMGFDLPLVYNSSGYDSVEALRLLEGVIDVYLPDMRYSDNRTAKRLSSADDYVEINRDAIREMHRQVGNLVVDEQGIAQKGLLIRHLVLPHDLAGSQRTFRFIREEISPEVYVSLMGQYFPSFKASEDVSINRKITREEYELAKESFFESGLASGWMQENRSSGE
jgi:putative pyruvate formate lyase activating enzyme